MKSLKINNKEISYQKIIDKDYHQNNFSEYEIKTLDFCHHWLTEKEYFIVNTSGSTGMPKEIKIYRQQMIISAQLTAKFLNLKANQKAFICLSSSYIAGMMMIVRAFITDMQLFIYDPSANPLIDINENFDFAAFVPLQLYEIIKNTPEKVAILNSMKNIIIGGGIINYNLEKQLIDLKANIYHTYGMTETITHIALRKINGLDRKDYFTVLENTKISLDNRNCLVINSPVTENKDVITNDLVKILSDKDFKILGRIDNMINSGGVKIQIEDIESAVDKVLSELKINTKYFVSSINDEKFGEIVVAVFQDKPYSQKIQEDITNSLKLVLKKYQIPKRYLFIDKIRETATGKYDKKQTILEILK